MYSEEREKLAQSIRFLNPRATIAVNRVEVWSADATGEVSNELTTTDLSIRGRVNMVYGNIVNQFNDLKDSSKRKLNRIVFKGTTCHSNTFNNNSHDITFGRGCCYNSLGVENYENVFGFKCSSNHFGDYCCRNVFGYNCNSNKFGDTCSMNTFGNACNNNVYGIECQGIFFGDMCSNNRFENACNSIAGGSFISFCKFGNSIVNMFFGNLYVDEQDIIHYEELESGFRFVEIGNMVRLLQLKCTASRDDPARDRVQYISIGDGISNKTI